MATRQSRIFNIIKSCLHGCTPEGVSICSGEVLIDVRRCFSTLKKQGKIVATGEVKVSDRGHLCKVWKAK